jgi:site-specific DNA-methyltransferase (adenine-specific)
LKGTGDFRSPEVTALRDEADIIITNPPFSLFREFLAWIIEAYKQFAIIGNMNAITYKEVFPLIKISSSIGSISEDSFV